MGDNSWQWAHHIREPCGVEMGERRIIEGVVAMLRERYEEHLPLIAGAREAVVESGARLPPGPRLVGAARGDPFRLAQGGARGVFSAWLSSDDVAAGKPAPTATSRSATGCGAERARAAAVEDSRTA